MNDTRLRSMLARAQENERKLRRFERLELRIIGAETLAEVFGVLLQDYPRIFSLDITTLVLVDPEYEMRHLLETDDKAQQRFPHLSFLGARTEIQPLQSLGTAPWLGPCDGSARSWLFPVLPTPLQSVAVLPLVRHRRHIGAFCLGSHDRTRFTQDSGTDFLKRFAHITALCVDNALSHQRLLASGMTDPLTGTRNRRFFDQRLLDEIRRTQRADRPLGFLFLDIDHFKRVNDTHGHQAGDAVLRAVAGSIQQQLRASDVLARYGGEEFAALLPDADLSHAREVAERIRAGIAQQAFQVPDGQEIGITLSLGVATYYPEDMPQDLPTQAQRLVEQADRALYKAKENGRNRVVCATVEGAARGARSGGQ